MLVTSAPAADEDAASTFPISSVSLDTESETAAAGAGTVVVDANESTCWKAEEGGPSGTSERDMREMLDQCSLARPLLLLPPTWTCMEAELASPSAVELENESMTEEAPNGAAPAAACCWKYSPSVAGGGGAGDGEVDLSWSSPPTKKEAAGGAEGAGEASFTCTSGAGAGAGGGEGSFAEGVVLSPDAAPAVAAALLASWNWRSCKRDRRHDMTVTKGPGYTVHSNCLPVLCTHPLPGGPQLLLLGVHDRGSTRRRRNTITTGVDTCHTGEKARLHLAQTLSPCPPVRALNKID